MAEPTVTQQRPACDAIGAGIGFMKVGPSLICDRPHGHKGMHHDPNDTQWGTEQQQTEEEQQ